MIDSADYNFEILSESKPVAKKTHRCGECYRSIMPGEKYLYEAGVGEDGFVTFKTCQHCMVCRDLVLKKCHGFVYGEILQDLYDHTWPGIPWRGVAARMYIGMRRKWQKFLNPELMPLPQGDA